MISSSTIDETNYESMEASKTTKFKIQRWYESFNSSVVCGASLRNGIVWITGIVLGACIFNCVAVICIYTSNSVYLIPFIREEILYWAPLIFWIFSIVTFLLGTASLKGSDTSAKLQMSTAFVATLFCTLIWVVVYGIHFSWRLQTWYNRVLIGGFLKKGKNLALGTFFEKHPTSNRIFDTTMTAIVDPLSSPLYVTVLPFPLDVLFWFGWRNVVAYLLFAFLPLVIYSLMVYYSCSYVNVVAHGGDGSEKVPGNLISVYYSGDEAARARIVQKLHDPLKAKLDPKQNTPVVGKIVKPKKKHHEGRHNEIEI